ncbi:hypothetical protein IAT40_006416 [Kwoniella sp. CBS 6097]
MDLHSLADAALADATTTGRSPITLPPISTLISPIPSTTDGLGSGSHTAVHAPPSGSKSGSTIPTPVSGSSITFPSYTPVPAGSAFPPLDNATDQPTIVAGWSPTCTQPQRQQSHLQHKQKQHRDVVASGSRVKTDALSSAGVASVTSRSKKGSKPRGHPSVPTPSTSAVPLEYNVRPYNRVAPSASTSATGQRTRTQPSRAARASHPLKHLKLDRTYPERSPQVWHEDAQRLLRPPRTLTPPSADRADPLNKHSAAQSLIPPSNASREVGAKRFHPPIAPWNELHPLPQMPLDDPYLPQTQESNSAMRPTLHRHQSSSSYSGPSWHSYHAHQPYALASPSVDPRLPQRTGPSRPSTSPESAAYSMRRSLSAHTTAGSTRDIPAHLPTSEPGSPQHHGDSGRRHGRDGSPWGRIGEGRRDTNGNGVSDGNGDGSGLPTPVTEPVTGMYDLSRPALSPPTSSAIGANRPSSTFFSRTITPSLSLSALTSAPSPLDLPKSSDIDRRASSSNLPSRSSHPSRRPEIAAPRQGSCPQDRSFDVSGETSLITRDESLSREISQPDLEMDHSSCSDSTFEPMSEGEMGGAQDDEQGSDDSVDGRSDGGSEYTASRVGRGIRLRLRVPSDSRRDRQSSRSGLTSSSSLRARSSSTEVKNEPAVSPTTSTPSPAKPKRAKTSASSSKSAAGGSSTSTRSKRKGVIKVDEGSVTGSSRSKGQRRNGERRREQNAVAQKKFRFKKKQIAAQMEADLESATALAASLKRENEEKDRLVLKLRGELGTLKRKLERLET